MRALITGGGGFLGSNIARQLRDRGDHVTVLGRHRYAHLEQSGIQTVQADIRDVDGLARAFPGMDVVFHTAALAGIWGRAREFRDINVAGTQNVVESCQACGVGRLIFTSSPSVVFGTTPLCHVDESQAYPRRYLAAYPETKAAAERIVLGANSEKLATVALRPHLIWGPGDPHLMPRVIDRARRGELVRVGDGHNLVDITYIDNAAQAHLLAADALAPGSSCAGRSYFVSQGEPVNLWNWLNEILLGVGLRRVDKSIGYRTAHRIGWLLEVAYGVLGISREPRMTRFLAAQLAHSHYFDVSAARRDLGYEPRVSTRQGVTRLLSWLNARDA